MDSFLFPIVMIALMWVLLVRPQQKRVRAQRALLSSLSVGDEVLTAGGLFGRIVEMGDERVRLEIAPGLRVEIVLPAVTRRIEARDALDLDVNPPAVED